MLRPGGGGGDLPGRQRALLSGLGQRPEPERGHPWRRSLDVQLENLRHIADNLARSPGCAIDLSTAEAPLGRAGPGPPSDRHAGPGGCCSSRGQRWGPSVSRRQPQPAGQRPGTTSPIPRALEHALTSWQAVRQDQAKTPWSSSSGRTGTAFIRQVGCPKGSRGAGFLVLRGDMDTLINVQVFGSGPGPVHERPELLVH